jgi:hypothetical protein
MGFPGSLLLILFALGSGQPILPRQEVSSASKPGLPTAERLCSSGAFHVTGVAGISPTAKGELADTVERRMKP